MQTTNESPTGVYRALLRGRAAVWADLSDALRANLNRSIGAFLRVEVDILPDEVRENLSYGRD